MELLVKVWEGIREFLEVPNESTGSFFRHMRVCGFPNIGISQKSGFRAFLWISGCFYGDFKCPRAPEIHIFCLKSRFLREILKKARNPNFRENHMGRPLEREYFFGFWYLEVPLGGGN